MVLGVSFPCVSDRHARLCIDPIFGPTAADVYRSSTADADDATKAWVVNFYGGAGFVDRNTTPFHVRAVRGAPRGIQQGRVQQPYR
jgi:hypothetical protein